VSDPSDCLRVGGVIYAKSLFFVVADIRMNPSHVIVGIIMHDVQADRGAFRRDRDLQSFGKDSFNEIPGHTTSGFLNEECRSSKVKLKVVRREEIGSVPYFTGNHSLYFV
jgi:hypothetical protein